ncbi:MAG: helicase [Candidatus Hydrothermarchaeota archaeon]|nr:MAG: helicase [Candidatus Hydrothermarchaeota archaeon]
MFHLLNEDIRKLLRERGIASPTEIQALAIPEIIKGNSALLIAPTGTGKTEAAFLPVFHKFLEERSEGIAILYITPLRALNRDLLERILWWGEKLKIKVEVRHGDTSKHIRRKQALAPPEMLITTPETLQAILIGKVMRRHLKNVRFVIVDEVHELAEDKRGAQLSLGLERLREIVKQEFQRVGISATIGSANKVAKFLGNNVKVLKVSTSKEVEISVEKPKPKKIDKEIAQEIHSSIDASSRVRRIRELINKHSSTLIFVNTRELSEILASRLKILNESVGIHHSSLSQEVRVETEKEFKEQKLKALVCTSSLELGIDIGSINLVIQYKSPRQVTRLLQRIGRSGHRLGKKSKGIIITTDADDALESLVIARRALKEKFEDIEIEEKPYDVLAHQLVGLALDFGRITKERAYNIIKRSYVFRNLTYKEMEDVLELLNQMRLLWVEQDRFGKTKNSRKYYYENLSTIPDERKYFVKNIVTQENIGSLDEAFVANYVEEGVTIIFKGSPWRILSISEKEILVEPSRTIEGAIPSWVGEEIPTPYEIAREVGKWRRKEKIYFPCDDYTKKIALSKIRRQKQKNLPIPSDKLILIEIVGNIAIIHSCFGLRVNQTLGRLFSALLTSKLGHSIALQVDAYRIILHAPKIYVKELFDIDPEVIEPLLSVSLKRTSLFRWKFLHVARRFGAISREVSYADVNLKRIIKAYEGTAIYKETLKELFSSVLDIKNAKKVLQRIKNKEIELKMVELKEPSPIAELGLKAYSEIILPERAERIILKSLKDRILNKRVELFCLYCAKWSCYLKVKNIDSDIKCENCGAKMLAILKRDENKLKKLYRRYKNGERLSKEEMKEIKAMQTSANLFLSYGKLSVIALAGRGIGPEVAKRVLGNSRDEEELYRNILKAEREYARTRQFWD